MTPSQAAPPFSDIQDQVSISLTARIVNLTDREKVLDADDRIDMKFDVNNSINVKKVIEEFANERHNGTSEGLNDDLNDEHDKTDNIDTAAMASAEVSTQLDVVAPDIVHHLSSRQFRHEDKDRLCSSL